MQCFAQDIWYVLGTSIKHINAKFISQVPFDYENPEGDKFSIALLKVPANVSTSDTAYRGSVLINPGGPGGSGVDIVLELGREAQTIIGTSFDVIGFDPRGEQTCRGPNDGTGAYYTARNQQDHAWNRLVPGRRPSKTSMGYSKP